MPAPSPSVPISIENEKNPWLAAAARFASEVAHAAAELAAAEVPCR